MLIENVNKASQRREEYPSHHPIFPLVIKVFLRFNLGILFGFCVNKIKVCILHITSGLFVSFCIATK